MRRQVQELLANQGLEAVKVVLNHLQDWSMDLEMQGVDRPASLVNDYRRTRRLHDYMGLELQNSAQLPEFEFEPEDADLLVSCCMFAAENLESALIFGLENPHDREWAKQNMYNLYTLAFEFALSHVVPILGPGRSDTPPPEVQGMVQAINDRVGPSPYADPVEPVGGPEAPPPASNSQPIGHDPHSYGAVARPPPTQPAPTQPAPDEPPIGRHAPVQPVSAKQAPTQLQVQRPRSRPIDNPPPRQHRTMDGVTSDWTAGFGGLRNPLPDRPPSAGPEGAAPVGGAPPPPPVGGLPRPSAHPAPGAPTAQREPQGRITPPLPPSAEASDPCGVLNFDIRRLNDPRLRSMMVLETKALNRAMDFGDQRLSAVHLSSIFEGVVIDVALQRRQELGLRGTPESWQLGKIVPVIFGSRFAGTDRNTVHHLVNCKNLVRPSVQLVNPLVVTRQTVVKMIEFVQCLLDACELTGG